MFKIGDLVKRSHNHRKLPSFDTIGVIVRVKEHDNGTDIYDVYFVEWIKTNQQYAYEAKELILVSEA